jgi:signal transduction histidine kinase
VRYPARIVALTLLLLGLTAVGFLLFIQISFKRELDHYLAPEQVEAAVRHAQLAALTIIAILILPVCTVAWLIGRSMVRPLESTAQAVRRMSDGTPPGLPHFALPEAEQLVNALRTMHEGMGAKFGALQRSQAEAEALVNAMVEGVVACDASGRVTIANPAARRLLGYDATITMPELPLLFRQKQARELVAAALKGTTLPDREVELDDRTCLITARGLPGGGAVVVLHDLTELRKLEAVRRDFVANVSHELKTPLTSIAGYAETLLADLPEPETTRRFLDTILQNARRMQELVDDQLDLSRIESGHWRPAVQSIRVEPLLREAWEPFETSSRGSLAFRSEVETGAELLSVDPAALRQILSNLYDNARRHTPPGGAITVRLALDGAGVLLTVQDTGSGIGSEHLPRIFERFYRADPSRSRAGGGSGLGLAIVKHLVESHGGRVWATSALGEGTTIACWFPRETSPLS